MRKKIGLSIFVILICLVVNYNIDMANAATVDKEPPKLISFKINNSNAYPGKKFKLNIEATDDVSGLKFGSIGLHNDILDYTVYQFDIDDLNNPYIMIPDDAIGGEFKISHLMLEDKKGNYVTYYNKDIFTDYEMIDGEEYYDFGDNIIKIVSKYNYGDDLDAPVVSNVTVDKTDITLGDNIEVCAKITDKSEIKFATVSMSLVDDHFIVTDRQEMYYEEDRDLYCAYLKPSKSGNNFISDISVTDMYDNSAGYYSELITDTMEIIDMPIINVDGPANVTESPVLVSVKLNKQSVVAPGSLKMFVDAYDSSSKMKYIYARFISEKEYDKNIKNHTYSDGEIEVSLSYDENLGKYVGDVELDQYAVSGNYYLQSITLTNVDENSSLYVSHHYPEGMSDGYTGILRKREVINDLSFEVKEEFKYDVVTSTINDNIVDIIKAQNNNAVIMIDASNDYLVPEGVFDAIKGTNKTIYIEANGYQWVFNGKDITNIKSIDTEVYSEVWDGLKSDGDSEDYIAIVFKDNGLLPGKAKIRVKTDYTFRYIEGYENLNLYYYDQSENKYDAFDNKIVLTEDGFYEFEITHNSKYILCDKKIDASMILDKVDDSKKEEEKDKKYDTDSFIILFGILVSIVCIIIACIVVVIRNIKNKKRLKS